MPGSKSATPLLSLGNRGRPYASSVEGQQQLLHYNSYNQPNSPPVHHTTSVERESRLSRLGREEVGRDATSPVSPKQSSAGDKAGESDAKAGNNGAAMSIMCHFKSLVNSFNNSLSSTSAAAAKLSRRRSLSRGVSLDDTRRSATTLQLTSSNNSSGSGLQPGGTNGQNSGGHTTPHTISSATTPTSGTAPSSGGEEQDEEREESFVDKPDVTGGVVIVKTCFPAPKQDASVSPSRKASNGGNGQVVHRTMILNNSSSRNDASRDKGANTYSTANEYHSPHKQYQKIVPQPPPYDEHKILWPAEGSATSFSTLLPVPF
uniref:Uncharacterized protein n=1 Tax=Ditylenchus dipsaci TaxID=166011 RepID=A0A915D877_9BILA